MDTRHDGQRDLRYHPQFSIFAILQRSIDGDGIIE
jgi:hypothetical protein